MASCSKIKRYKYCWLFLDQLTSMIENKKLDKNLPIMGNKGRKKFVNASSDFLSPNAKLVFEGVGAFASDAISI